MAETVTFRPNVDNLKDFDRIMDWCNRNESSFNSIINSLLPAIAYTLANEVRTTELGEQYMRCDFGDILLLQPGPYIRKH